MTEFTEKELLKFHNKISENVKKLRNKKEITQLDLSLALGFKNSSFISHAENPKLNTHHYSIEHIYKISKVLNVDLNEFFK